MSTVSGSKGFNKQLEQINMLLGENPACSTNSIQGVPKNP